jgi:hypothetical protein
MKAETEASMKAVNSREKNFRCVYDGTTAYTESLRNMYEDMVQGYIISV